MMIDFHTHIFPDRIAPRTLEVLSAAADIPAHTDGTTAGLAASMAEAGIDLCVNLPVMTSALQVHKVNDSLYRNQALHQDMGILSFAGIHPDLDTYADELRLRKEQGFIGIKLHPAYQRCDLDDPRFLHIIDCACNLDLVVLTHAGVDIGIPGHNYASVEMILHVIEQVHPEKFVLAHMGGWDAWDEVSLYLAGAPVYFDTAFSVGANGMEPMQFYSLCKKHGTDRILFATDSPWSVQKAYVDILRNLPFSEEERCAIFAGNASRLLLLTACRGGSLPH